MRRIVVTTTVAVTAACLCVSAASAGRVVRVGQKANRTTVTLRVGDTLVVSLPGNATTGYFWRELVLDRTLLRMGRTSYVPRKTPAVGAGGTYVLRFRAVAAGKTYLKLGYVRSRNRTALAARTFALVLIVRPAG